MMVSRAASAYVVPSAEGEASEEAAVAAPQPFTVTDVVQFSRSTDPSTVKKQAQEGEQIHRRGSVGLGTPPAQCTLSWSDVSYTVTRGVKTSTDKGKTILKGVSGRCASGEITAVMGPSGCGKTTLLDILADRISTGTVTGTIALNGQERKPDVFRRVARYVAQEDSLLGCFTVRETLAMAAQLTLPRAKTSASVITSRVDSVITAMGLTVCEHAYIGDVFRKGISGGQKRRLSIAIELLSNPSVLLLDEPTSGLDSAATVKLLQLLGRLCQQGRTVLCTIHQPSSLVYDTFTNVMVLAKGETVYFGPRAEMIPHFASLGYACPRYANPCEYFIGLVNADFDGHGDIPALVQGYATSAIASAATTTITSDRSSNATGGLSGTPSLTTDNAAVSAWQQFVVLLARNLVKNARNPGIFVVRLVMYVILALCVGTMYLKTNTRISDDDIVVLLFGIHCFFVFNSVAVVPFFIDERAVFLRERGNSRLNVGSFVVANFLAGLPGILTLALSASVIVVAMTGLKAFGWYLLNMFLSMVAAESLMHVLGVVANNGIVGIAIGASLFGSFMLCEGFMVPKHAIPGYWLWVHYLGFHSYAFEAFIHHQFLADLGTAAMPLAVQRLGITDVDPGINMLILAAFAIGFELVFAAILYKVHTGRR